MGAAELYQVEVKLWVVKIFFHPANDWRVSVDVDAMEVGKGGRQSAEKIRRAKKALAELRNLGAHVGPHDTWGRVDVAAEHRDDGVRLIEVEGESRRQKDQALYSALGQSALVMKTFGPSFRYGLAVPDSRPWRRQLAKVPKAFRQATNLDLYAVAKGGATMWNPQDDITEWGR